MSCLADTKILSPDLFIKTQAAFSRLRRAAEISEQFYEQPLLVCYSGGKDSDVLVELARRSGIRFEVVHSHTTADSPVTVRYTRQRLAEFASYGIPVSVHYPTQDGKRVSMWSLISQRKMPPTRKARYCCEVLKEAVGKDRCVATGVRWSESIRRQLSRGIFEAFAKSQDERVIVATDVAAMGGGYYSMHNSANVSPLIQLLTGRMKMSGNICTISTCRAIRNIKTVLRGLAASAVRWLTGHDDGSLKNTRRIERYMLMPFSECLIDIRRYAAHGKQVKMFMNGG